MQPLKELKRRSGDEHATYNANTEEEKMYIIKIVIGESNSYLVRLKNGNNYYWGPKRVDAHQFPGENEALQTAKGFIPENIWHNIATEIA